MILGRNFVLKSPAACVIMDKMVWEYVQYDEKLAADMGAYLGVSPILGALV